MKRLSLVMALVLAFLAGTAWAQPASQAPAVLSSAEVSLWPEYDRAEMLVIYRGEFTADTALPLAVEVRIPASAGAPTAVAYVGDDGGRYNQPYDTIAEGEWLVVSFELSTNRFQLEYYAPLAVDGSQKTYEFAFRADYPVTALDLDVLAPPTAEDFALDPAADRVQQDSGLSYHLVSAGTVAQGETRIWTVTYRKADALLTADSFEVTATPQAVPAPAGQSGSSSTVLIFFVAFIGLVAVGLGAFWLGRRVQPAPVGRSTQRRPESGTRTGTRSVSLDDALYCPHCSARLRPDADFCHKCGADVRRP